MFLKSLRLRRTKSKSDSTSLELSKAHSATDSLDEQNNDYQLFLRQAREKEEKRMKASEKHMKQVNMNPWTRGLD